MNVRHFNDLPDILTPEEVKEFFKIGRNTVYRMLKEGEIPSVRIGKLYRVPKMMLAEMLGSQYDGADTLPKKGAIA